ncbi:hypothetical protein FACS1894180_2410 [Bacteroidia bacterium]|nr:hypothetical protein FACS1894180_2410 [Bacteroidia bacterium]
MASVGGCKDKEPTCTKCENGTDTVYIDNNQHDSIMNLLCHRWKLEAFVNDRNGTYREPEYGHWANANFAYTLKIISFRDNADSVYKYDGYGCPFSFGGILAIETETSTIMFYKTSNIWTAFQEGDGDLYFETIDKVVSFEVTADSLRLFPYSYPYSYDCLLFKKFQEQ